MHFRRQIPAGPPVTVPSTAPRAPRPKILLVGNPNVGKSVLFNALTGARAVVSNYPGTTVEVSRGTWRSPGGEGLEVVDTPGIYSLNPITDEERVTRDLLLSEEGLVVQVVDAKNLPRMLSLTLELAMLGRPMVLVCNLMDEAEGAGVRLDETRLAEALGIPVLGTVATRREGLEALERLLGGPPPPPPRPPHVPLPVYLEKAVGTLEAALDSPSARFWALRHLEGDPRASEAAPLPPELVEEARSLLGAASPSALAVDQARALRSCSREILGRCFRQEGGKARIWAERLDSALMNPWTGLPILAVVVYLGLYQFVGVLGGQVLVGYLEDKIFLTHVNPFLESLFERGVPWPSLRDLFVGEYGILTLGLRYAVAIILPIVGTFFLAFSILEDSGYLPRLAMLLDGAFKRIGLNGRAVIPVVIGFGCDTMGTLVTRVLESRRERIIATFLLALAVPCSAQLGLILGLLGGYPAAFSIWIAVITGVFLVSGTLLARFLPGERPSFFMELPPMRWPSPKNVWTKTVTRMGWYFLEVIPLFVLASALIWLGRVTALFDLAVRALQPVAGALGLPPAMAKVFLFGFFRRDYGAAGLYEAAKGGGMDANQILVAAVTLTLFLPCVAQFLIMKKERGWAATLLMSASILALAFGVGWSLNAVLGAAGVSL